MAPGPGQLANQGPSRHHPRARPPERAASVDRESEGGSCQPPLPQGSGARALPRSGWSWASPGASSSTTQPLTLPPQALAPVVPRLWPRPPSLHVLRDVAAVARHAAILPEGAGGKETSCAFEHLVSREEGGGAPSSAAASPVSLSSLSGTAPRHLHAPCRAQETQCAPGSPDLDGGHGQWNNMGTKCWRPQPKTRPRQNPRCKTGAFVARQRHLLDMSETANAKVTLFLVLGLLSLEMSFLALGAL